MHIHLPKPLHGWREFVGEVGIIVIGVLLALAAEQFIEWLHWRSQQHERLERLFEESRIDLAILRGERDFTEKMTRGESEFATALSNATCPSADRWNAAMTVAMYPPIVVPTSVYDEVVDAGGLSSIQSNAARQAVSIFHSRLVWAQEQNTNFRSHAAPPFAVDDSRVTVHFNPGADELETFSFDRDSLCRDHGFRNKVVDSTRDHAVIYSFRKELADAALRTCGALGQVLGKTCTPSRGEPLNQEERKLVDEGAETVRND